LGYAAGDINTTGSSNTFVGYKADAASNALTNATAIGANASVAQSNSLILGNGADVGIGTNTPIHALDIYRPDTEEAVLALRGNSQGTGRLYIGQSLSYGGGIVYNGDGTPAFTGGTTDSISFYRTDNNVHHEVFSYAYNSNDVIFNGNVGIGTTTPAGKLDIEDGGLYLSEIAAPATPSGSKGVVYEKSDKLLYFKNAGGDEFNLTAGGGDTIVHDWMSSHAASRHIQFNITTGELYIVGEIAHGLNYYNLSGGFWWCSFGDYGSSPILTALLREYINEGGTIPLGLGAPYNNEDLYSVLPLTPLTSQNTYQNSIVNQTAFLPANYSSVTGSLKFFIYQELDDQFFIGVMDDVGLFTAAPGEGGAERDNGVRMDIAFKATLTLPSNKTNWLLELDDNSTAYDTEHPAGF